MKITTSQLQKNHKALVDALKRHQSVEITYHGKVLGVVHPVSDSKALTQKSLEAMDAFFGMHRQHDQNTVEQELREIRKGRRKRLNDL